MRFWGNLLNFVKIFLPYNYYFPYGKNITLEQEAHGPHRSPEKTVQINKQAYIIPLIKRRKNINFSIIYCFFIWRNLNPPHSRMLCAKIGWNWLSGSEKEFFNFVNAFSLFYNYLPLEKVGALHLNKRESPSHKDALWQFCLKLAQ